MARLAKSLETLRRQIDEIYPNRSKVSDGWIGDTAHAARKSDHNPNSAGVVQALDITHDPRPGEGPDTWKLAEILRINRDPRIKYVISNGRIFSSEKAAWVWREYTGSNKHDRHIHVSVSGDVNFYDNAAEWKLSSSEDIAPRPVDPDALRENMANLIVSYEDAGARLKVSTLKDGTTEVAGINSRFHAAETEALKTLVEAGKDAEARKRAGEYILRYTDVVQDWTNDPGLEFYLRDTFFNRGPSGAAIILQKALGVEQDGRVGSITKGALAKQKPDELLLALRAAREAYERDPPPNAGFGPRNENSPVWKGMVNRWNKALAAAQDFMQQPEPEPKPVPEPLPTPLPSVGTFIHAIETITAQITAEKDKISAAFARMVQLSDELKRLTDRGIG